MWVAEVARPLFGAGFSYVQYAMALSVGVALPHLRLARASLINVSGAQAFELGR